jgi:hypothetical protein
MTFSFYKKVLAAALGIGMAAFVAVPIASAARPNSLPAGTKVTGSLKSGTDMTFAGTINGVAITVKCTSFSASGKVPSGSASKVTLSAPPKITGCTDSLGGTDTIKTNQTNGKWTLTVTSSKPYKMSLGIPKAGATFTSSILSSCVITAEPKAAGSVSGSYNDKTGTDTVKNAGIPTSGSGCTSATAKTSATVVLTPNPGAPPF